MYWIARDSNNNLIHQFDEAGEHYLPELNGKKILSVGYYDEKTGDCFLCSLATGIFYFPDKAVETEREMGGRTLILERQHTIIGNEHKIRYVFGFWRNGKRWETDTEKREVKCL